MAKIISVKVSVNNDGKEFISIKLQGGIETMQSLQTGKFYLTARTCYISSTFSLSDAEALIGCDVPGNVVRVPSDAYLYTIKETGEVISLTHRYEFLPENKEGQRVRENTATQSIVA
jgi:hypothetical protein